MQGLFKMKGTHMGIHRRAFLQLLATAAAMPALSSVAHSDDYPSRPIRLVVGFPQGGPVDIAGRVSATWLSERLGQPVVVDNQPGESGNMATRSVARADPDGYTLLVCGPVNTINTTLLRTSILTSFAIFRRLPVSGKSRSSSRSIRPFPLPRLGALSLMRRLTPAN